MKKNLILLLFFISASLLQSINKQFDYDVVPFTKGQESDEYSEDSLLNYVNNYLWQGLGKTITFDTTNVSLRILCYVDNHGYMKQVYIIGRNRSAYTQTENAIVDYMLRMPRCQKWESINHKDSIQKFSLHIDIY